MATKIQWIDDPTSEIATYRAVAHVDVVNGFTPTSQLVEQLPYSFYFVDRPQLIGHYQSPRNSQGDANRVTIMFRVKRSARDWCEELISVWCDKLSTLAYGLAYQDLDSIQYRFMFSEE